MSQPAPTLPGIADARRLRLRSWLPPAWRAAVAGQRIEIRIPEPVARRLRKPRRILPSEWSVRHRRMPAADAHPGKYRPEFARFAAKVMDTWAQPWVREVWYCGIDQGSKTNTMLSCLGWSLEQAPGNVFYQMPDEASSDKIMGKKLIPMLRGTPRLARLLSPRADDTGLGGVTLASGVSIIPSWSGSPTSTAMLSARYTFSDEVDKMRMVGKEADPVDRIKKRTRTNRFSKHFFASTPAGAWIYRGTKACAQVWTAAGRCPHCGQLVVMDEKHLDIPEGATEESIKADPSCVGYMCNASGCGERWDEEDRKRAYDGGDWVCIKGAEIRKPADVGFLLSAFPVPDVPLAQIAVTVLRAKAGNLSARRDLAHGIKAVDADEFEKVKAPEAAAILKLARPDLPALICPPGTVAVAAGVDMQKVGFWATLWAFPRDQRWSHLAHHAFLPDWDELKRFLFDTELRILDHDALRLPVWRAAIDTGGGPGAEDWSRTEEAYLWLRKQPRGRVWGIKGQERGRHALKIRHSVIDKMPGRAGRPIPGGLVLWLLDSNQLRDDFWWRLTDHRTLLSCGGCRTETRADQLVERGGACPECGAEVGGWADHPPRISLCADVGPEFAAHVLGVEKRRGRTGLYEWVKVKQHDLLDASIYAHACADVQWMGGVAMLQDPVAVAAAPARLRTAPKNGPLAGRRINPYART